MGEVYAHIGLPKSGTTYLQRVLWESREGLARNGVLIPGQSRFSQTLAVWDFMGRRPRGAEMPQVAGAWDELTSQVRGWPGARSLISEEFLVFAKPRQIQRFVSEFLGAQVHVVVTVRDLARVLPATWQQNLQKGETASLDEFLSAVQDPERGRAILGAVFWLRQDVARILSRWERFVPPARIHVVTVPPPGTPPHVLLERFAAASRLDPEQLKGDQPDVNRALGVAEAEVVRRLNVRLGDVLNERQYTKTVVTAMKPALTSRSTAVRIELPVDHFEWVQHRAREMVNTLNARGYDVVGDLQDLIPQPRHTSGRIAVANPDAVADAAIDALSAVTHTYAQYWWRTRRADRQHEAGASRLASNGRAAGYRLRMTALGLTERSRTANRVVAAYLRRR